MKLIKRLNTHPVVSLCSLALLIVGLLSCILYGHFSANQQRQQAGRYGQALADSSAAQAVEPTLAQDMISLQVILQSLAQQPEVVGATIHDVENHLLVQSGKSLKAARNDTPSFTAPITLDDHIAGYLTVTLLLPPTSYGAYGAIMLAVTLICIAILWLFAFKPQPQKAKNIPQNTADIEEDAPQCVDVKLLLLNLDKLRQQLSRTEFNLRAAQLEQNLQGVLALYEGCIEHISNDHIRLSLYGDTLENASFYALCLCQLIVRLSASTASPVIKIAAQVSEPDNKASLIEVLAQAAPSAPAQHTSSVWIHPQLQCEHLHQHVSINCDNTLAQIKPPYEALLQRQEQQLAQHARESSL